MSSIKIRINFKNVRSEGRKSRTAAGSISCYGLDQLLRSKAISKANKIKMDMKRMNR